MGLKSKTGVRGWVKKTGLVARVKIKDPVNMATMQYQ